MTLIPHRTVANQLATQLKTEIAAGTWRGWLPSERELCRLLQASRNSVRSALDMLRSEGLVEAHRGTGHKLISRRALAPRQTQAKSVGVIIPEPVGRLRPFVALWIDELKDLLLAEGCRLKVHEGGQLYKTDRSLGKLVAQNPHNAWVLTLSSQPMQQWFSRSQVPCLVAGSTFADINLPHYDLDYRSTCRHAVGVLIRHGHQRIALLNRESRRAGDMESELGFLEGVRSLASKGVSASVAYHRDDVDTVRRALSQVLDRGNSPTALLVSNSYAYLATASLLAQRGKRIPQDISLLSRDDDPFLEALAPMPARYVVSPHQFAKRMVTPLLRLVQGDPVAVKLPQLLPKFTAGDSLGAPAAGKAV